MLFLHLFELYRTITVFESAKEYFCYALVCMISCNVVSMLGIIFSLNIVSIKEHLLAGIFIAIAMIFYRVIIRFFMTNKVTVNPEKQRKNLLIIGAGEAGRDVIKNIKTSLTDRYNIVGVIDDNNKKKNCMISGARIVGNRRDIPKICKEKKIDIIFFAISNISAKDRRDILSICQETGIKLRILPGIQDIINEKNIIQSLRDVEIDDILGRDPIVLDNHNIKSLIQNHTWLHGKLQTSLGNTRPYLQNKQTNKQTKNIQNY